MVIALDLYPTVDPTLRRMNTPHVYFDHEKLVAYQRSIQFVSWAGQLLEGLPSKLAVSDQLERASTSVPLNIAEGNAKHIVPDRCRYFDTARGSALECAACLDVLVAKGRCTEEQIGEGKQILREVISLLVGLTKSIAPDRLGEDAVAYVISRTDGRQEQKERQPTVEWLNSLNPNLDHDLAHALSLSSIIFVITSNAVSASLRKRGASDKSFAFAASSSCVIGSTIARIPKFALAPRQRCDRTSTSNTSPAFSAARILSICDDVFSI